MWGNILTHIGVHHTIYSMSEIVSGYGGMVP
jgi:hypothetical protein